MDMIRQALRRDYRARRELRPLDMLRILWDRLVEHDADCAVHKGHACTCGAAEFRKRNKRP